ncbi:MAG: hypothetical protein HZA58_02510 [Acidimicrobiia bacterium]|nr:hypothetical protein [Acidimicrobiia bacterium]
MGSPGTASVRLPEMRLPVHGITRYLRVRIEVDDGVLRWAVPRALLGLVPIGVRHVSAPVSTLRSVGVRRVVTTHRLLTGLVVAAIPWFYLRWWWSLPITLVGAAIALTSIGLHLEVTTGKGRRLCAPVCEGHKIDAALYADGLRDLIARAAATEHAEDR